MNFSKNYNANREYKATLFAKLFGEDKENALSLYNAVNNSNYTNADELTFTTLDDVVYMKMKNDVSFLFDKTMSLYEHQSTYNPNMPLRGFLYFADLYRQRIKDNEEIYSKNIVKIPAPKYIVFYNGSMKDMPEKVKELYLSDAFDRPTEQGKVDQAVDECVESGVLEEFLNKHRKEVRNMVLTEFDEEKFLKMVRAEERAEGRLENFLDILRDLGEVPLEVVERAKALNAEGLKEWSKLAARVETMQEFLKQIK
ncbi:MAG: hypothetical protein IKA09_09930 [Lachnospiraceae bacterium]|nr:hypothetical protein [Lachnospiraceae bacterium]